jgi:hypothetical protein
MCSDWTGLIGPRDPVTDPNYSASLPDGSAAGFCPPIACARWSTHLYSGRTDLSTRAGDLLPLDGGSTLFDHDQGRSRTRRSRGPDDGTDVIEG